MASVPTQAELVSSIGLTFLLAPVTSSEPSADGTCRADGPEDSPRGVAACLAAVRDGISMDAAYLCYSASFDLPQGVYLPQDLYRVTSPGGDTWDLLVTPTRPRADGAATMCAVFHVACPAAPPADS